ncbi:riboflavin synthase [Beijerinckia indica]|uniref:Riboflavin synthase n=1 Tax=Beijerinckia indica subsp. indica (strain ATCC 9039 / DSM 1715 / NCIMB 8712) TaxID=395963 RepID=B2IJJ5_BEII9|nr:riboflavin synthase [Beijerinckia indica]ACB94869.1 riboflavin synthase, alpha subunit [Beijerinckia indica subsp. indica ATCC 9039]
MFTGLISDVGEVGAVEERGQLRRLRIFCSYPAESVVLGASIACNGPCLTVVAFDQEKSSNRIWFEVDVGAETLARTTAEHWTPGTKLNLERSLKVGDELGGHIVTGHVDAVAEITAIDDFDGMRRFSIRVPESLARFIAEKGSVSLDGTSLTVNSVEGNVFSVLLIPHTLAVTTWGGKQVEDRVNLEVDLMARYAARLTETS